MQFGAEIEDEDVMRESFKYLYEDLPYESFERIAREIFTYGSAQLRDWMGLVFDHYSNDKRLIPILKDAIQQEKILSLKKDLEQVLDDFQDKN